MEAFNVIFYSRQDGTRPVEEFIASLDSDMRAKVFMLFKCCERTELNLEVLFQSI